MIDPIKKNTQLKNRIIRNSMKNGDTTSLVCLFYWGKGIIVTPPGVMHSSSFEIRKNSYIIGRLASSFSMNLIESEMVIGCYVKPF